MATKVFFDASRGSLIQITDLFDFVWPTASAMWNLRWMVKGFVAEVGLDNMTDNDLLNRFDWGSGIHGVNLRKACLETTWEVQQEQFGKFLLLNLFAVYEGWIAELQEILSFDEKLCKKLQFPTRLDSTSLPVDGVKYAISRIQTPRSDIIYNAFYNSFTVQQKYSLNNLDNLLICYRYFKECRNCFIHSGGIADQKTENAYIDFAVITSPSELNVREIPKHYPIITGQPIKLSLRGVVGLCDILIRLIVTIDNELSISINAETEFVNHFREWSQTLPPREINKKADATAVSPRPSGKGQNILAKDTVKRSRKIGRITRSLGYPYPLRTDEIETLLLQEGIFKQNYDDDGI